MNRRHFLAILAAAPLAAAGTCAPTIPFRRVAGTLAEPQTFFAHAPIAATASRPLVIHDWSYRFPPVVVQASFVDNAGREIPMGRPFRIDRR